MKKVVSATLAGALAVGMVPAMALADDSVELQVAEEKYDVAKGTVTAAVDYAGNAVDLTEDVVFTAGAKDNGKAIIKITEFETATGIVVNMADTTTAADYTVAYYEVSGSTVRDWSGKDGVVSISDAVKAGTYNWAAGEYYVTVRSNGADGNIALALKFEVEASDIEGAYLYEAAVDAAGKAIYTDTEFAYAGKELALGLAVDGKPFADATVTYYKKGTNVPVSVLDAGSYVAEIDGLNDYEGYEEQISFEVAKADLASAAIVVDPAQAYRKANPANIMALDFAAGAIIDTVNAGTDLLPELKLQFVSASNGKTANIKSEPGTYTYKLYAPEVSAGVANPNIVGDATVTLVRYEEDATFEYDEKAVPAKINFKDYDEADFVALDDKGNELASTVKYYKNGKEVSKIAGYGTYQAVLVVDSAKEGYEWGGSATLEIEVTAIEIDVDKNAFVKYDGKVVTADQKEYYNGSDFAELIEVVVLDNKNKALTAGVDYDVVITDAEGKVVTEIVNWGVYTITIKENADSIYKLDGDKVVEFEVEKAPATAEIIDQLPQFSDYDALYTGEEINPIEGWFTVDGDDAGADPDAIEIPASAYKVEITYFKAEGAAKEADPEDIPATFCEAGEYKFDIVDADDKDNYVIDPALKDIEFAITAKGVFVDVPSDAWYADEVATIVDQGIMGGYTGLANTKFGPNDTAKRQDVAVIALRTIEPVVRLTVLPSGTDIADLIGLVAGSEIIGDIDLPFADTKDDAYYSLAVWYCNKHGIMTGYADGSNEFGVNDDITREQVAAVLYRMSKTEFFSDDATLYASALDAYADADEVSGYAVEAMEWAVENGIFGVNTAYLNPGDPISRAELAAVIVRLLDAYDLLIEDSSIN